MKIVIYLAGLLILFATAFGLKDYIKGKKQGTLVNYNEPLNPAPVVKELNKQDVKEETKPIEANNSVITEVKKKDKPIKKVNTVAKPDTLRVVQTDTAVAQPVKKPLNMKMFSRGRID